MTDEEGKVRGVTARALQGRGPGDTGSRVCSLYLSAAQFLIRCLGSRMPQGWLSGGGQGGGQQGQEQARSQVLEGTGVRAPVLVGRKEKGLGAVPTSTRRQMVGADGGRVVGSEGKGALLVAPGTDEGDMGTCTLAATLGD